MHELLTQLPCTAFVQALASRDPVPGGGGASAITGALGAALCSMAGSLSAGSKSLAISQDELKQLLVQCQRIQTRLLELVEEDAAAFVPLSQAYSIPKDNPDRDKVMEQATLAACRPPLEIMRVCCQAIDLVSEILDRSSPALISDVGCGALLCRAALESASLNVYINTRSLRDQMKARQLEENADSMLEHYLPLATNVSHAVLRRLRNGSKRSLQRGKSHADAES